MPRSSFSSSRSSSTKSYAPKTATSPPTYSASSMNTTHTHKIEQPGFFSNVLQGFGLGAGQSIAFNMFRSPTEVKHIYESSPTQSKEYLQCMKESDNDKEACKQYLDTKK